MIESRIDVPTPDFYQYDWTPLASVAWSPPFVEVSWFDGVSMTVLDLWLRESAVGIGVDPATREGIIDPAELLGQAEITEVTVDDDGALRVRWGDRAEPSIHHPGWLRHVAMGEHLPERWLPSPQPWRAADLAEPPSHSGPAVLESDERLCDFLNDLATFGLARLRGLGSDDSVAVAARIGPRRGTNFGDVWDVKAVVGHAGNADTNSTANTNLRLGPHTDLPTRETPPGFQFLHCIENQTEGGHSTMADGLALVQHVEKHHPDEFDALTTLRWVFFNRGKGIDHRWSGPLIDLGRAGSPLTLRAFYPVRAFPDMPADDQPRAYQAMGHFSELADSARFKLEYPFEPGDLVAFDNRRVLHGRNAFSAGGARHLRGFYIDHDDVHSTTRALNRAAGWPRPPAKRSREQNAS